MTAGVLIPLPQRFKLKQICVHHVTWHCTVTLLAVSAANSKVVSDAGECGLGKTSFIYNLVSGFKVVHPGMAHLDNATTMRHFKADPSRCVCSRHDY